MGPEVLMSARVSYRQRLVLAMVCLVSHRRRCVVWPWQETSSHDLEKLVGTRLGSCLGKARARRQLALA
jgi:hypothetical protein